MSTLGTNASTLQDWASRQDPDGKIAKIVEILNDTNPILDDMMFIEGNLPTGHKTTIRSGLPTVAWRILNYGVQPSKAKTVQVTDTVGMLEGYAEVDKDLADLNGTTNDFRLSEDTAFLESMSQEAAGTLFYGNTASDPEEFLGLAPRYALSTAENGTNVIASDGTGSDNTSIWLITWGALTCHGIFPKGSKAGLTHKDLGEVTLQDSQTPAGNYQGYRSHYQWKIGLCLRDWRYVVRISNIDISNLTKNAATGSDLVDLMIQAVEKLPSLNRGRMVWYANATILSMLRRQIKNTSNVNLTLDTVEGKKVLMFDGIPVKRCDALLNTESLTT